MIARRSPTAGHSWLRAAALSSATVLGLGACNLVGYDTRGEAATADEGTVDDPGATTRARDAGGELDGGARTSALDAALHGNLDGALVQWDGGPLEAGWWTGRAPDQTCASGERCYPDCQTAQGLCVFDCASSLSCENSCLPNTACEVACQDTGRCFTACKEDSQCWVDCHDAQSCEGWCTKGSHCQIDCANTARCTAMCLDQSSCEIDCSKGADCSQFSCAEEAQCLMYCGSSSCDFACAGTGTSCPGNIRVCNRECP